MITHYYSHTDVRVHLSTVFDGNEIKLYFDGKLGEEIVLGMSCEQAIKLSNRLKEVVEYRNSMTYFETD